MFQVGDLIRFNKFKTEPTNLLIPGKDYKITRLLDSKEDLYIRVLGEKDYQVYCSPEEIILINGR